MPHVQAGDVSLHYVERGDGDEPLVFIHGFTGGCRDWDPVLERLPARFRAYAIDLRGAGESDRPGSGYNLPQYIEDINLATRALGLDTFTLIGHSMGGGTGMLFAVTYPERLRRLVLVAPVGSDGVRAMDPEMRAQMKALRQDRDFSRAMRRRFAVRPLTDQQIDRSIDDNLKWQDDAYDEAWESMRTLRLSEKIAQMTVPTLMIVGDRDMLRADNLQDAQRIPNCALQVFYRVGHLIQSDVPDEFTRLIDEFVEHGTGPIVTPADRAKAIAELMQPAAR